MRIGIMHDSILPPQHYGGIERIVVSLAIQYKKRGHDVVVISRAGSHLPDFENFHLPSHYEKEPPHAWLPANLDFLHAHQPLPLEPKIPYLVTIHGNGKPTETYWPNTNFLSASHAGDHSSHVHIYNGVDPARFPMSSVKEDYLVFLAKASWRVKNLKTCIDVAHDTRTPLLVMGGSGRDSEYIKYLGMVGEANGKLEILSKARALLYLTNWNEPCAVAPLESMACGTPVISSQNGCMPELVENGRTGFLCDQYSDVLRAVELAKSLNPQDCRARIDKKFSLETMAEGYLNLMEKIRVGNKLEQIPQYRFDRKSVRYLYKPTAWNNLRFRLTGKI